jgi:hypothetical protein
VQSTCPGPHHDGDDPSSHNSPPSILRRGRQCTDGLRVHAPGDPGMPPRPGSARLSQVQKLLQAELLPSSGCCYVAEPHCNARDYRPAQSTCASPVRGWPPRPLTLRLVMMTRKGRHAEGSSAVSCYRRCEAARLSALNFNRAITLGIRDSHCSLRVMPHVTGVFVDGQPIASRFGAQSTVRVGGF